MALFGLISEGNEQVLTEYKADIKDHKAGLKELEGAEKELAATRLEALEANAKGLEETIRQLGQVSFALLAVKEIGEVIWDGYKEGITEARLETSAMGIDIEKLGEAAGGLKTHLELLTFAAKASNSAFHNSQEDMEMAERAMRALEARGYSAAEAQDAVTNALVSGKTKGLEPFGIVVDKHIDKLQMLGEENMTLAQRTEVHQHALESLRIVAEQVVEGQDNIGDSMTRTEVTLSDAWAQIKIEMGELVVSMGPVIAGLVQIVALAAQIGKYSGIGAGTQVVGANIEAGMDFANWLTNDGDNLRGVAHSPIPRAEAPALVRSGGHYSEKGIWIPDGGSDETSDARSNIGSMVDADPRYKKWLEEEHRDTAKAIAEADQEATEEIARLVKLANDKDAARTYAPAGYADTSIDKRVKEGKERDKDEAAAEAKKAAKEFADEAANTQKSEKDRKSMVAEMFGSIDEIHATHIAFKALTDGVASGYEAMVKGTMSFGEALKSSAAQSLLAEGKKMQIMALEAAAYGVYALATGPIGGVSAASFFQSAAMFEAGAIAAGIAANALGAGGSGSSGSGSSSPAAPPIGSQSPANSNGHSQNVFVIGDDFADDTPRMRQIKAQRYFALAGYTSAGVAA